MENQLTGRPPIHVPTVQSYGDWQVIEVPDEPYVPEPPVYADINHARDPIQSSGPWTVELIPEDEDEALEYHSETGYRPRRRRRNRTRRSIK